MPARRPRGARDDLAIDVDAALGMRRRPRRASDRDSPPS